ncbi:MAG TPA: O-acetyl-ADP-ribose deacetylase [Planctomycetota bacterium]|nr:O-acetyl-ADP-ribose deacetylase [Planctomycetota bacterium]
MDRLLGPDAARGRRAMRRIEVVTADITKLDVDAVVNAANERLLGGGGVDGAIHRAAGPELLAACRALPEVQPGVRCPVGECRITPGFQLAARHVIHTVGPIWQGGLAGEPAQLASCYTNSLQLASEHGLTSIAFPAISCGAFGYPPAEAAAVARRALHRFLAHDRQFERVVMVAFDADTHAVLRAEFARL